MPAASRNRERAAVGRDEERGLQGLLARNPHPNRGSVPLEAFDARGLQHHAGIAASREDRGGEVAALHHMGERLPGLDLALEGEKGRTHRIGDPAVGDHHAQDRLCLPRDGIPDAERLKHPPRGSRNRIGPPVARRIPPQGRIAHHHIQTRAEGGFEGQCEG
jgi:hypothetical protein